MMRIFRFIHEYWFAAAPAKRLAILRILVGLFALYLEVSHYFTWVAVGETGEIFFAPIGVARILTQPLSPSFFHGLVIACLEQTSHYRSV
jgi:hypothetical protein